MKKILFCLVLLMVSLPVIRADNATPAAASDQAKAEKFKAVMGQLDLSDEQKVKVKQIMLHTEPGPDRRKQIGAVLTPEQKRKMMQLMREQRSSS